MADNANVTAGDGSIIVATDKIGGVDYQRMKVTWGVDGTATDVSATDPMPVTNAAIGAPADAAATTDTGTFSLISLVKRLLGLNSPKAAATADVHAPASNTAAIVTYAAAGAGVSHVIGGMAWSYSAAPTGGNLKIEDGSGTTVFTVDITTAGAGFFIFPRPKKGTANTAMIITLAAGGSGVTGKVNTTSHWTE